jgi:hypothetical protein
VEVLICSRIPNCCRYRKKDPTKLLILLTNYKLTLLIFVPTRIFSRSYGIKLQLTLLTKGDWGQYSPTHKL